MIARLWQCFGPIGTASVAGQLVAAGLLAAFWWRPRRTRAFAAALLAAVLAFVLAWVNSGRVGEIEVDRSAETAALAAEQRRQRDEALRAMHQKAADIQFAEDDPRDRLDLAGVKAKDKEVLRSATPTDYDYRKRGKQGREGGKETKEYEDAAAPAQDDLRDVRRLPEADVLRANRYDRINLFAVRCVLLLAVVAAGWDYLSRFHRVAGDLAPLPISGRAVDALAPASHLACLVGPSDVLRRSLARTVRKGETFLYFGSSDPWAGRSSLPRLPGPLGKFWPLNKIAYDAKNPPCENDFVFESAWFDRYCFAVSANLAPAMLQDLVRYLAMRQTTGARARRLVTVAWDLPAVPDAHMLEALRFLCRETHWRLIVRRDDAPGDAAAFDEVVAAPNA